MVAKKRAHNQVWFMTRKSQGSDKSQHFGSKAKTVRKEKSDTDTSGWIRLHESPTHHGSEGGNCITAL